MVNYLERFIGSKSMGDALSVFREAVGAHDGRIARSRKKINDIYAGVTPQSPYVEYASWEGFTYKESSWVDTPNKSSLSGALQHIIQELARLPHFDYIPSVGTPDLGGSGYICGLFGTEYRNLGGNGIEITKHAISSADEIKNLAMPDLANDAVFKSVKEYVGFFAEALDGTAVEITYPQLQGASTNSLRVLPQEEGLMSVLTDPDEMEKLALMVTRLMTDFIRGLLESGGGPKRFRPRGRFGAPAHVRGLMVDDWISVMSPESFLKIYASSYKLMNEELGDIFLHTCGPVLHIADLLAELDGIAGLETVFVKGNTKTSEDLLNMKEAIAGRYAIGSVELPDNLFISDEENLTTDLINRLSEGGGVMFHASGSLANADELAEKMGLKE